MKKKQGITVVIPEGCYTKRKDDVNDLSTKVTLTIPKSIHDRMVNAKKEKGYSMSNIGATFYDIFLKGIGY